ncbi:MAG TPA: PstS family phosphate ABC transporter substrate-binding protein [Anaerolineaceae bacterium]|nr:PstS family phosphate ABC transporter substrate-binding protein [Anaerolineaceae bacterium]
MKRLLISYLIFIIGFGLAGCANPTSSSGPAASNSNTASIQDVGSDTLVNLALAWAEQYQQSRPNIRISVTGGGSGTGLAALINGTTDIANASRAITNDEIKQAKANGENPTQFVVSRDAIAIMVNPTNPISKLTLKQISRIYKGETNNWSELGGENRPIVRLSRDSNSGTHVYFLGAVIRLGSSTDKSIFSEDTLLLPSSEGIIAELKDNPNAIGYDGLGYVTPDVKVIAVANDITGPYVLPSAATVNNNTYPISRDLYMYTNGEPTGALKDYIDWILSAEAQKIVDDLGFVPIKTAQ